MLTNGIKRKIDNCRDILVGKLPDPKSQIEQITIALIYKFMNDIDNESIELGGSATFFNGDFSKYKWSNIVDVKLNGFERLNLYAEAIEKMNMNDKVPQLFRNIFKNAFLPYRDPETFTLFAKEINEFHYEHSEELGNAFEYLLSIMNSQGDAGQFRTPRNIIDFMVNVIQPQKNESILDPACGTAGFLISAYKYIKEHSKEITPDEHKKLTKNIIGYDISPDMVRLSLVNLYLHLFPDPKIYEYDTLTSEDRWKDTFDIIMANPPFMTPKGGIKPHNKFAIKANRSEVLFIDYIMEHINLNGRAAVIVPEGIIFQSANAYKTLRKKLVEDNYLWTVVSLPAGVFNPYSGVKTSILFMDKNIAKLTDKILFIKIENDGFDLGAQRKEIEKNDLPDALNMIEEYKKAILSGKIEKEEQKETRGRKQGVATPCFHMMASKKKLAENEEYNLTGDRYRVIEKKMHQKWPMVKLGDVCEIISGQSPESQFYNDKGEGTPFYQGKSEFTEKYIGNPNKWTKKEIKIAKKDDILMSVRAPVGPVNISTQRICIGRGLAAIRVLNKILMLFLFYILKNMEKSIKGNSGAAFDSISRKDIGSIIISLPPLEVQSEIVAEIEGYQKIIDGAQQVIDNWKPKIEIDPKWPMVKLGEVCDIKSGGTPSTNNKKYYDKGNIPWLKSEVCKNQIINKSLHFITKLGFEKSSAKKLKAKTTLIALVGATIGKTAYITFESTTNQNIAGLYPLKMNQLDTKFLFYSVQKLYQYFINLGNGKFKMANLSFVKNLKIPLPSLKIQQKIVAKIEEEHKVVDGCKELIKIYEEKIKQVIDKVWDK